MYIYTHTQVMRTGIVDIHMVPRTWDDRDEHVWFATVVCVSESSLTSYSKNNLDLCVSYAHFARIHTRMTCMSYHSCGVGESCHQEVTQKFIVEMIFSHAHTSLSRTHT